MATAVKAVKELDLTRLRQDMRAILKELDKVGDRLDDHYSPAMWRMLQEETEWVAVSIRALHLRLTGMRSAAIADQLNQERGTDYWTRQRVAYIVAKNTTLHPDWIAPAAVIVLGDCPKCGAAQHTYCRVDKRTNRGTICNERRPVDCGVEPIKTTNPTGARAYDKDVRHQAAVKAWTTRRAAALALLGD